MNNLEAACRLSCENWIDSFPEDIPEHEFSRKHIEKMQPLLVQKRTELKPRVSRKSLKFILIAAILMSLATTIFVVAKPLSKEHKLSSGKGYETYEVITNEKERKEIDSLNVNYIPQGFEIKEKETSHIAYTYRYEKGNEFFTVDKLMLGTSLTHDTDRSTTETIKINGRDVILWRTDNITDYMYNDGEYIYNVSGNINETELVKIVQNIQ